VVYQGFETAIHVLSKLESGFWNFSRNHLAVTHDPPGDMRYKPSFWVSSMNRLAAEEDSPGGTNTDTLSLAVFDILGHL